MANASAGGKLAWFIVGVAIGAGAALLYAPMAGEGTREAISQKAGQGRASMIETGREMLERGRELYDRGRQIADQAAELFEQGRKLVEHAPGEGPV